MPSKYLIQLDLYRKLSEYLVFSSCFQTSKSLALSKKDIQSKLDVNEKDLAAAHLLISQVPHVFLCRYLL